MRLKTLFQITLTFIAIGCGNSKQETSEVYQKNRNKTINVKSNIFEIDSRAYYGPSFLSIFDDMLILSELHLHGSSKCIHFYNKNTLKYITSTGVLGKGPGEINRSGVIAIDELNRIIWVSDHGKNVMWKFPVDSIINNKEFMPTEKIDMDKDIFLVHFDLINDSIAFGRAARPLSVSSFEMLTAKFNLYTGISESFGYEHPKAQGRWLSNSDFKLSKKNNIYAISYNQVDLLTICNLDGTLKRNIYGPGWDSDNKRFDYFSQIDITSKNIYASYLGNLGIIFDKSNQPKGVSPTKILVFDLNGNYIHTLDIGYPIVDFCVDEENNRILAYLDEIDSPLVYINLN